MNDPRVTAVARIIREGDVMPGNLRPPLDNYIGDAEQALINADAADREAGIHRVRVDDATVERVARVLADVSPVTYRGREHIFQAKARAVLAALTGAES